MATIHDLANAIVRMEGSLLPGSVNMTMVSRYGRWNVGHLVWAGQRGAVPVEIGGRLWAGWPSYEESYQGLVRQIQLDSGRGMTLAEFIAKYAPPTENQTNIYIANVSAWTGIHPDERLQNALGEFVLARQEDSTPPLDSGSGIYVAVGDDAGADSAYILAAAGAVALAAGAWILSSRI